MNADVAAFASAVVNPPTLVFGRIPPPARKPVASRPVTFTVDASCGGRLETPKLLYSTSSLIPKPARIAVRPSVPGEYATPIRGMRFFFWVTGEWKLIKPGTLA